MTDLDRVAIMGNAGAGKSHLARHLSSHYAIPIVDLDDLFWASPGQYTSKRPFGELMAMVNVERSRPAWIVEGVYGELIELFLADAKRLVWLDIPWDVSRARMIERQRRRMRSVDEPSFEALLTYASGYWERDDARSHRGHGRIFGTFAGEKWRFTSEDDVNRFLEKTTGSRS